jgi:outer membrane protein OmpA-like peptidoglycan-associated protein
LPAKAFRWIVPIVALALGAGGCFVTTSTYEAKAREADSLRDALGAAKKEKSALQERYAAVRARLAEEDREREALAGRLRGREAELKETRERLDAIHRQFEGTRITREELISELLEKEKATGKRIQELSARAQACEADRERLRAEAAAREAALSRMEKTVADASDADSTRRERDILPGRVERVREEQAGRTRLRDDRFTELARTFADISPRIATEPVGPAVRVRIPGSVLFGKDGASLSNAGRKALGEMERAASAFPEAALYITTGAPSQADEIRSVLAKSGPTPHVEVRAAAGSGKRDVEVLLVVP